MVTHITPVRSHDENWDTIDHPYLRQSPACHQKTGNTGDEKTFSPAQSRTRTKSDSIPLSGDRNRGKIRVPPHRLSESECGLFWQHDHQVDTLFFQSLDNNLY